MTHENKTQHVVFLHRFLHRIIRVYTAFEQPQSKPADLSTDFNQDLNLMRCIFLMFMFVSVCVLHFVNSF